MHFMPGWRADTERTISMPSPVFNCRSTISRSTRPRAASRSASATSVAVAPAGEWAAVGLAAGGVGVVAFGAESIGGTVVLAGPVHAVAAADDGKLVLAGVEVGTGGALVGLRVDPAKKQPVVEKFTAPTERPIRAVATAGEEVVALAGDLVLFFGRYGRQPRGRLEVVGARSVAIGFEKVRSVIPQWSEP